MKDQEKQLSVFDKEIAMLPPEIQTTLKEHQKSVQPLIKAIEKATEGKSMGFYLTPTLTKNAQGAPVPNFDEVQFRFLLDDFEKPIPGFNVEVLLQKDVEKFFVVKKERNKYNEEYSRYFLKSNEKIEFIGSSISIVRENCYDSLYEDLIDFGKSIVVKDERGFISALKSVDIHRNLILQKFEKYVVVYAGAGSWLRGEKSNDFDVFVVVDDTDVKRLTRMQVKDQLSRMIHQLSQDVARLTGVQLHPQVYLLTDFWEQLKDAHPVMFTFLRDGVPFYDRGLYSAWRELLKLGKIRPSAEAIEMHMNAGTQLVERAKRTFVDIMMSDVYNAVLSPSQALLMLRGFNPTTPKETVRMFNDVLLKEEKYIDKETAQILEKTVKMFKTIEHDKSFKVTGTMLDEYVTNAEKFLETIRKKFEDVTQQKSQESVLNVYNEFLHQVRQFPGYMNASDEDLAKNFEKDFLAQGKLPAFAKDSWKALQKGRKDYDSGKLTNVQINKTLKEARLLLTELKIYREHMLSTQLGQTITMIRYGEMKQAEVVEADGVVVLYDGETMFTLDKNAFVEKEKGRKIIEKAQDLKKVKMTGALFKALEKALGVTELEF